MPGMDEAKSSRLCENAARIPQRDREENLFSRTTATGTFSGKPRGDVGNVRNGEGQNAVGCLVGQDQPGSRVQEKHSRLGADINVEESATRESDRSQLQQKDKKLISDI